MSESGADRGERALRLWPGVTLGAIVALGWFAVPAVAPEAALWGAGSALLCGPLLALWWLFFSRAPRLDRWGAVPLVAAGFALTPRFLHPSVAQGNMGFQFYLNAIPIVSLAFVAAVLIARRASPALRRGALVAAVVLACGSFTLLRSKGLTGDGAPVFAWRWSETAEEHLLADADDVMALPEAPVRATGSEAPLIEAPAADGTAVPPERSSPEPAPAPPETPAASEADGIAPAPEPPDAPAAASAAAPPAAWPGFRGPDRDGVVTGVRIRTDWAAAPPAELWRRPVGPGVSSFAARNGRLYTQEQRGDEDLVVCYDLATGEPVWRHADAERFWDSHVGAGPRATPSLAGDHVYALGPTGRLNALSAADGSLAWSREAAADTGVKPPTWGFVSSPLVVGDLVVVHAGALVAYDRLSGEPRWTGPAGGSYSSPQLLTIDGVSQIVMVSHAGVAGVAPADGATLWEHAWPGIGIMQPVLTGGGDLLISLVEDSAMPAGTRRLAVEHGPDGWTARERWTSNFLKPSFSPVVVHGGFAYGIDGRLLACIDLETGKRRWKGGRYGAGQVMLLADEDLLLVVSEQGELALVKASPDGFEELGRFPGVKGRTWNQPALVGDVLLVRNGEEMAAFRLALEGD